jgi:hypothetical protein
VVSLDFAPAAGLCPNCGHGWAWYDYDDGQEQCRHPVEIGGRGREGRSAEVCGCPMDFYDADRSEKIRRWNALHPVEGRERVG